MPERVNTNKDISRAIFGNFKSLKLKFKVKPEFNRRIFYKRNNISLNCTDDYFDGIKTDDLVKVIKSSNDKNNLLRYSNDHLLIKEEEYNFLRNFYLKYKKSVLSKEVNVQIKKLENSNFLKNYEILKLDEFLSSERNEIVKINSNFIKNNVTEGVTNSISDMNNNYEDKLLDKESELMKEELELLEKEKRLCKEKELLIEKKEMIVKEAYKIHKEKLKLYEERKKLFAKLDEKIQSIGNKKQPEVKAFESNEIENSLILKNDHENNSKRIKKEVSLKSNSSIEVKNFKNLDLNNDQIKNNFDLIETTKANKNLVTDYKEDFNNLKTTQLVDNVLIAKNFNEDNILLKKNEEDKLNLNEGEYDFNVFYSLNLKNNISFDMQYPNVLEIKDSKIHGKGIFTTIDIPESVFIITYEGIIIGKCMSDKLEKGYLKNNQNSIYMFRYEDDMIFDATIYGNKARYINHSCDPNCTTFNSKKLKRICYQSIKNIKAGTELTINYNFKFENKEVCRCGSNNCRSK